VVHLLLPIFLLVLTFGLFGIPRLAVPAPGPPVLVLLFFHLLLAADIDLIGVVVALRVRSLQVVVVGWRVVVFLLLVLFFLSLVGRGVVGIELGFSGLGRRRIELDVYQALHTA
jgi:hypothetical protein